jgi:hypothetical protein
MMLVTRAQVIKFCVAISKDRTPSVKDTLLYKVKRKAETQKKTYLFPGFTPVMQHLRQVWEVLYAGSTWRMYDSFRVGLYLTEVIQFWSCISVEIMP